MVSRPLRWMDPDVRASGISRYNYIIPGPDYFPGDPLYEQDVLCHARWLLDASECFSESRAWWEENRRRRDSGADMPDDPHLYGPNEIQKETEHWLIHTRRLKRERRLNVIVENPEDLETLDDEQTSPSDLDSPRGQKLWRRVVPTLLNPKQVWIAVRKRSSSLSLRRFGSKISYGGGPFPLSPRKIRRMSASSRITTSTVATSESPSPPPLPMGRPRRMTVDESQTLIARARRNPLASEPRTPPPRKRAYTNPLSLCIPKEVPRPSSHFPLSPTSPLPPPPAPPASPIYSSHFRESARSTLSPPSLLLPPPSHDQFSNPALIPTSVEKKIQSFPEPDYKPLSKPPPEWGWTDTLAFCFVFMWPIIGGISYIFLITALKAIWGQKIKLFFLCLLFSSLSWAR